MVVEVLCALNEYRIAGFWIWIALRMQRSKTKPIRKNRAKGVILRGWTHVLNNGQQLQIRCLYAIHHCSSLSGWHSSLSVFYSLRYKWVKHIFEPFFRTILRFSAHKKCMFQCVWPLQLLWIGKLNKLFVFYRFTVHGALYECTHTEILPKTKRKKKRSSPKQSGLFGKLDASINKIYCIFDFGAM